MLHFVEVKMSGIINLKIAKSKISFQSVIEAGRIFSLILPSLLCFKEIFRWKVLKVKSCVMVTSSPISGKVRFTKMFSKNPTLLSLANSKNVFVSVRFDKKKLSIDVALQVRLSLVYERQNLKNSVEEFTNVLKTLFFKDYV